MNVLLIGGPFDGQERQLDRARTLITLEWSEGTKQASFGDITVDVEQLRYATYVRQPDGTFRYAPLHETETGLDELPSFEPGPNQLTFLDQEDRWQK